MLGGLSLIGEKCVFCSDAVDDLNHFNHHNVQICLEKSESERTFARKDLLKQHVLQKHLVAANDYTRRWFDSPNFWSETVDMSLEARWRGFYSLILDDMPARMSHVAQHFRSGLDMTTWEPWVATWYRDSIVFLLDTDSFKILWACGQTLLLQFTFYLS